jgi:hypothetical protein
MDALEDLRLGIHTNIYNLNSDTEFIISCVNLYDCCIIWLGIAGVDIVLRHAYWTFLLV